MTDRKRKADVLGRLDSSSTLGRGSLSGWTLCPLCPNRKKQYALGRGISAHLYAVHTPWLPKKGAKRSKRQRRGNVEEGIDSLDQKGWQPTAHEEEVWAQQVLELTAKVEKESNAKRGVDRTGKPSKAYVESLPPFLQAASGGNTIELLRMIKEADSKDELVKLLSTRDRNGSTPEHWAAGGGHIDSLKLLLEHRDALPEEIAVKEDEKLEKKRMRRRDGKTCLHYAARNGKLDCVQYLVEVRGEAVDARSGDGTTPLHMACFGGATAVVEFLMRHGANVSSVNDWACSPAHWVAMTQSKDHAEVTKLCQVLLKAGISFASVQKQGHSALHKAAQKQNRHFIEWLAKAPKVGGPGLTMSQREEASKPDNGGHRPSDIWLAAGGDVTFSAWIKREFEIAADELTA